MKKVFLALGLLLLAGSVTWAQYSSGYGEPGLGKSNIWTGTNTFTGPVIITTLQLQDGTAAAPSLTFASDTNTGLYRIGGDQIGVTTGGVLRLDVSGTELDYLTTSGTYLGHFQVQAANHNFFEFTRPSVPAILYRHYINFNDGIIGFDATKDGAQYQAVQTYIPGLGTPQVEVSNWNTGTGQRADVYVRGAEVYMRAVNASGASPAGILDLQDDRLTFDLDNPTDADVALNLNDVGSGNWLVFTDSDGVGAGTVTFARNVDTPSTSIAVEDAGGMAAALNLNDVDTLYNVLVGYDSTKNREWHMQATPGTPAMVFYVTDVTSNAQTSTTLNASATPSLQSQVTEGVRSQTTSSLTEDDFTVAVADYGGGGPNQNSWEFNLTNANGARDFLRFTDTDGVGGGSITYATNPDTPSVTVTTVTPAVTQVAAMQTANQIDWQFARPPATLSVNFAIGGADIQSSWTVDEGHVEILTPASGNDQDQRVAFELEARATDSNFVTFTNQATPANVARIAQDSAVPSIRFDVTDGTNTTQILASNTQAYLQVADGTDTSSVVANLNSFVLTADNAATVVVAQSDSTYFQVDNSSVGTPANQQFSFRLADAAASVDILDLVDCPAGVCGADNLTLTADTSVPHWFLSATDGVLTGTVEVSPHGTTLNFADGDVYTLIRGGYTLDGTTTSPDDPVAGTVDFATADPGAGTVITGFNIRLCGYLTAADQTALVKTCETVVAGAPPQALGPSANAYIQVTDIKTSDFTYSGPPNAITDETIHAEWNDVGTTNILSALLMVDHLTSDFTGANAIHIARNFYEPQCLDLVNCDLEFADAGASKNGFPLILISDAASSASFTLTDSGILQVRGAAITLAAGQAVQLAWSEKTSAWVQTAHESAN